MKKLLAAVFILLATTLAGAQTVVIPPGAVCNVLTNGLTCLLPDTTAPVLSGITLTDITQTSATINAVTDESATVRVEYGLTTAYGQQAGPSAVGTAHAIALSGLTAGATYHYRLTATDTHSNTSAPTADATFTTIAPPPPPVSSGTWTKLATTGISPRTGGWSPWVYNDSDASVWYFNSAEVGTMYRLSSALAWTRTQTGGIQNHHNCPMVYVGDNAEIYIGGCAPDSGQPGSFRVATSGANQGTMTFVSDIWGGNTADAACAYDRTAKKALCLGGWGGSSPAGNLRSKVLSPYAGLSGWTALSPSGGVPALAAGETGTVDANTRTTYNRCAWSQGVQKLWCVDGDSNYWTYDLALNKWTKLVTTGSKPPSSTSHARHDATGMVVGLSACVIGAAGTCDGGGQTYLLDTVTGMWSLGPGPTQGPTRDQYWSTNILYHEARQSVLYMKFTSSGSDVWEFVPAVAPPPPPPPVGSYPDLTTLPVRVFVPVECGPKDAQGNPIYDMSPWPCLGGSKHQRWAADGQGNAWTGFGDTNPTHQSPNPSQNQGYKLRLSDGAWSRWNPACRPPGQIQPSYPDELTWAYDARGYFWLLGGVTQGTDGVTCSSASGESGSTLYKTGLFKYTPATDRWERFASVDGTNALWGHFDNTNKNLMWAGSGGTAACGSAFFKLNVDTLALTSFNLCLSTVPFPGSPSGTFENYVRVDDAAWAWDETGRTAYFAGYSDKYVAGNNTNVRAVHFYAVNVDTGVIAVKADPPNAFDTNYRNSDPQDLVFDSTRRRVIYPYTRTHCGAIEGMYVYDTATDVWASHSTVPSTPVPGGYVRGNSAVYDPFHDVLVLGGSVACTDWGFPGLPNITHYFLWRG